MVDDHALSEDDDRFPLLELPDVVLANVLQRCPPGSIAGFPLPLALAQVRLTGSVDPNWARPLLHVASKCPAVLDRVSTHLRSIEFRDWYIERYPVILPQLSRLESLEHRGGIPLRQLSALPTSLTKLSVYEFDLEDGSLEDLSASLLRLTALEDLDLSEFPEEARQAVSSALPLLRRLKCRVMPPLDLGTFAPKLEALEAELESEDLEQLPITLTKLRFGGSWSPKESLLPLTRLTGLKDLALPSGFLRVWELPELLGAVAALTHLWVRSQVTNGNLPHLLEALEKRSEGLDLCLSEVYLNTSSSAVERLFRHLVEVKLLETNNPASLPWAALTRLTRLVLEVDGSKDASWIQPLSQLPSLRELEVRLKSQVPAGFGALTQCTKLSLRNCRIGNGLQHWIDGTATLSGLQPLIRLRECELENAPAECLAALPDCLTKLHLWRMKDSPDLPLGKALRHLTVLEDLFLRWPEGEDRACDLSPLKRLTRFYVSGVPCPLVRLGSLPCLRRLYLSTYQGMDDALLRQLGEQAQSLRELRLRCNVGPEPLTDASLVPLLSLSLLEVLELPTDIGGVTPGGIRRLLDHLPLLDRLIVQDICIDHRFLRDPAWAELKQQAGNRLQM